MLFNGVKRKIRHYRYHNPYSNGLVLFLVEAGLVALELALIAAFFVISYLFLVKIMTANQQVSLSLPDMTPALTTPATQLTFHAASQVTMLTSAHPETNAATNH